MARLVAELRPRWVIGENVRGFVNQPMGLERSLSDLARIGYQAVPFIIGACSVDAPHRRDRVWIIAHADSQGEPDGSVNERTRRGQLVADADNAKRRRGKIGGQIRHGQPLFHGEIRTTMAHASDARLQGCEQQQTSGKSKRASRSTAQRSQNGGSQKWQTEPDVGRVAHGISNRVDRLKALGNAVVPQVVTQIGRAIIDG